LVCISSPAVVSVRRRWSTVEWKEPSGPARQVGGWLIGSRVGKRDLSLGRCRSFCSGCYKSFIPERSLLPMRLTMLSYFTPSVVLGVRRVFCQL
ncbi:hypothetical protein BHE74_00043786, partial [Ensete ventricosum]